MRLTKEQEQALVLKKSEFLKNTHKMCVEMLGMKPEEAASHVRAADAGWAACESLIRNL